MSLIENGSIVGLLTDSKSSLRYGLKNTGNGRQESYRHPVLPRMCNTFLGCGRYKKDEIIDTTKNGVYALDIGGGHVDISTGEFVFNIFAGMYIKNGKPHAITNPFLFRGNIFDVFNQIDMIGEDLDFQFGTCIKKGQMVPVSYGQPTIRITGQLLGE